MSLEKVAIKNQRPGVMVTPALRPPEETDTDRDDERLAIETKTLVESR